MGGLPAVLATQLVGGIAMNWWIVGGIVGAAWAAGIVVVMALLKAASEGDDDMERYY
jgi:hypothetical protein